MRSILVRRRQRGRQKATYQRRGFREIPGSTLALYSASEQRVTLAWWSLCAARLSWMHRNKPGARDEFSSSPPARLEMYGGIVRVIPEIPAPLIATLTALSPGLRATFMKIIFTFTHQRSSIALSYTPANARLRYETSCGSSVTGHRDRHEKCLACARLSPPCPRRKRDFFACSRLYFLHFSPASSAAARR